MELPRWDGGFDAPIESIWSAFAQELGGCFVPGDLWAPDRLELPAEPWTIRVWVEQFGMGQRETSQAVTIWEARYRARVPFFFRLRRRESSDTAPLATRADAIRTDDPQFDRRFALSAEPPAFGAALVEHRWVRDYLEAEGHIGFEADQGSLRCIVASPVRERDRLLWVTQVVLTALHACRDAGLIEGKPAPQTLDRADR